MNKLLTLLIIIFVIFGCGENFTDKNTTNSTEQGGSNTGDNTGSGSDSGNTGDNTGNGSDSGDTGDNAGNGSDSGDTGDNTGDGSDNGDTGDNAGNGSDSGDTGNNTGDGSDSGDTGDNTGDGSDNGDTGDNTGDGSDSGDTGDNTGDGSDSGDNDDNTGDGSDSGDTGDNAGNGSDSGDNGDNTGDGSDSGNTGDNTGDGSDSGDTGDNTGSEIVDDVRDISIKSCMNTVDEENNPIKLCEQEIDELTLDLNNKISAIIQGDAKPQNAANRLVYYSVEPSSLASIDGNGNVTAKNTGKGTITVQSDSNPEIKKSIPLTITNSAEEQGEIIPVQAIGFEETSLILQMGETYKLTPKFTPVNTTERDFECSVGNLADFVDMNKDTCEITGKKLTTYNGLVEIKSKNKELSDIISPVTVVDKKISLENFSITPKSITVDKDQTFSLTDKFQITYNPTDTNEKDFNYSSSNSDILFKVSGSKFRPDNVGVATITVTSKFHPEMFEEVIVNIKDPYDKEPPVYNDINPSDMATHSDRMYIKIMFDVISSTGDIKNNEGLKGINQIDVQPSDKKGIELITKNMNGYISNYGFCEKYGCMQGRPENEDIAVKSSGINYYVGHNDLYIPVRNSGKSTYNIYTIFSFGSARLYYRSNEQLVIDWDQYNPEIHKNAAKFHIILKDRTFSSTFDGFDTK